MKTNNKFYIYRDKYILGLSSLWLLIPFFYNILYSNIIYIKIFILLTTSISTIFWGYYSFNSLFHKLDNIFATILFIILTCYSFNINYIILPFMCFLFYYLSCYFYKNNKEDFCLLCHFIFRYIGFWWTMLIFSNIIISFNIFIFYSLFLPLSLFIYTYKNIYYKNQLQILQENFAIVYSYGIVQTISILFILLFTHLFIIEYYK